MKLRGIIPNFYVHVSVNDLYIPTIGPQTQYSKIGGPIIGIYKSLTDTWMQKFGTRPCSSFLGIFVSNFRYIVWYHPTLQCGVVIWLLKKWKLQISYRIRSGKDHILCWHLAKPNPRANAPFCFWLKRNQRLPITAN